MKRKKSRKWISLSVILSLAVSLLSGIGAVTIPSQAAGYGLGNPTTSGGVTTWDCVWFGNYWQNDTNGDGTADQSDKKQPIKWRVLSVNGDDAFLLADQCLDCQRYNTEQVSVTWETCTLRTWLNQDFYSEAFSSAEQSAVKITTVVNEDNPYQDTEGGNNTTDKVYLLSLSEVTNSAYGFSTDRLDSDKARYGKSTEYVEDEGAWVDTSTDYAGNSWWLLRSPGHSSYGAASVDGNGYVYDDGLHVSHGNLGVRPALHLNLSSSQWSYAGTVSADGTGSETGADATVDNMDYLALSALAYVTYSEKSDITGKTIGESKGQLDKFITNQQTKNPNDTIPHTTFNMTYKEFVTKLSEYIKDWKIVNIYNNEKQNGFYAIALEKGNNHVLAIRGSQDLTKSQNLKTDWADNATYGFLQQFSSQMGSALKTVVDDKASCNVDNYYVTGHSLGGGLATFCGNYLGVEAVTFDGSPTTDVSYYRIPEYMAVNFSGVDKWNTVDYLNEHCPVGSLDLDMKNSVLLKDRHGDINPFSAHDRWSITDLNNSSLVLSPEVKTNSFKEMTKTVVKKDIGRVSASVLSDAVGAIRISDMIKALGVATSAAGMGSIVAPHITGTITSVATLASGPLSILGNLNKAFPAGTLYLGSSGSQGVSGSLLRINHTDVLYGGDGDDVITGFSGDDYLIGGNGDDFLDGEIGNDHYIYWNGQGTDTIRDISGKDELILNGFSDNDNVTVTTTDDYLVVKRNGSTVVKISKFRNLLTSSFKLIVNKETKSEEQTLSEWNGWKKFNSYTIGCPTKVQIYNSEGELLLELEDELEEPIYKDYGQFYVSNEDGEVVKHAVLEEGYDIKVVATDDGAMNFISESDDGINSTSLNATNISLEKNDLFEVQNVDGKVKLLKDDKEINLQENTLVRASEITVDKAEIELKVGDKYKINATLSPKNSTEAVKYESLNSDIATVDSNGNVTAVAKGEAVISVYTDTGITTNIKVVVKEKSSSAQNNSSVSTTTNSTTASTASKKSTVKKPTKVKSLKVKKKKKKKAVLTFKKVSGAKGYQIQYALNKKFTKGKKSKFTKKAKYTVKKLKKKKTYYFRVRAYKLVNGTKKYGKWSAVKKLKIKK